MAPQGIPYIDQAHLDLRVLAFAVLVALLSGILFGTAPFWSHGLRSVAMFRATSDGHRARGRQVLLVAQLSMTIVLLAAAGLLVRSVSNLQSQSLGIHTNALVTATAHFGRQRYANDARKVQFVDELQSHLAEIPGVSTVTISDSVPPGGFEHDHIYGAISVNGRPRSEGGTGGRVAWRWVTPGYFDALGIRIIRGSRFSEEERQANGHFVVLSEALANRIFPGEDPVGRQLIFGDPPWYTIVGVAANAKNGGLSTESEPEYYRLWRNRPEDWTNEWIANFTLSTRGNPKALESVIHSEAATIDSTLAIDFQTMHEHVISLMERPRFEAAVLSLFAALALLLAAIGLYGVIAFSVAHRTREIAVRIALGASKQDILKAVGSDGIRIIGIGIFLGVIGALSISRLLKALLFRVSPHDSLALLFALAILLIVAAVAMWFPLRRAIRIDPIQALRYE
jgi:predicted permease